MARIVAVHGISQQFKGAHTLHDEWFPALRDGLDRAGYNELSSDDLICCIYGDLFRKKGSKSLGIPEYDANDVEEGFEQELLEAWWLGASAIDTQVPGPEDNTKLRTPRIVQRALNALGQSSFFSGCAEHIMIGNLKQVARYLHDVQTRSAIQNRVVRNVGDDTRVLIGHSLGSVVAYEALCANPDWHVDTFVTLGSPLGIEELIFRQLNPRPDGEIGHWPNNVKRWMNIADVYDIVALEKSLSRMFGHQVQDFLIDNGCSPHDVTRYLTAKETGRAIALGLNA